MAVRNPCPQPVEYQATTNQCCAFSPWVIGASAPLSGTPLGRHWMTGEPVCCDTLTWFMEGLIANPSAFVLSLPGKGKSTLIRKMFIGAVAQGHTPIVAGDMKGEYVTITQALGGQVLQLGVKGTHLNPLGAGKFRGDTSSSGTASRRTGRERVRPSHHGNRRAGASPAGDDGVCLGGAY